MPLHATDCVGADVKGHRFSNRVQSNSFDQRYIYIEYRRTLCLRFSLHPPPPLQQSPPLQQPPLHLPTSPTTTSPTNISPTNISPKIPTQAQHTANMRFFHLIILALIQLAIATPTAILVKRCLPCCSQCSFNVSGIRIENQLPS